VSAAGLSAAAALVLLKVSFLGLRAVSKVRWLGLMLAAAVALDGLAIINAYRRLTM
jgi:hypothetical protein